MEPDHGANDDDTDNDDDDDDSVGQIRRSTSNANGNDARLRRIGPRTLNNDKCETP
jgi:hypothetical protein